MMNLHQNKQLFKEIISYISNTLSISPTFIEKDYYVTLLLNEFVKIENNIVFKGGTSLSKCFHLIDRFSEDIDLNYLNHDELNRGKRKRIKNHLNLIVEKCGLIIENIESTHSNRNFNRYEIPYERIFKEKGILKDKIIIEISYMEQSYPVKKVNINSIIGEYLINNGYYDICTQYNLNSFEIYVQDYQRTFIDKIFAICDYYLLNKVIRCSRHLYDLYKLYPHITFDKVFVNLFNEVREERSNKDYCLSSQSNQNICILLEKIIVSNYYKKDYENITKSLINDNVTYQNTIDILNKIMIILKDLEID